MNTLDVCCALIELPGRTGPSSSGRQKENGAVQRASLRIPRRKSGTRGECPARRHTGNTGRAGMHRLPVRMLTPVRHREPERIIRLIPFLCRLELCALPRPLEHENLGFFSRRTLEELPWAPADRLVLKEWLEEHR